MSPANKDLPAFFQHFQPSLEAFLDRLLPPQSSPSSHRLALALRYSTLSPGKRLRPALVYASAHALNVPKETWLAAAASVELIHCYSLIHDDLPAMDNDDLRRGRKTCHIEFDEATAILAGDALQSLAFEILANPELNPVSAELRVEMILVLARASGPTGMVLGQAEDMAAETQTLSLPQLIALHQHKTGALIQASVHLGALAAGCQSGESLSSLLKFGDALGLAFQVQDDILDLTGTDASLGKPQGSDLKNNKSTFPSLLGLEGAREKAKEYYEQGLRAIESLGEQALYLKQLAGFFIERSR